MLKGLFKATPCHSRPWPKIHPTYGMHTHYPILPIDTCTAYPKNYCTLECSYHQHCYANLVMLSVRWCTCPLNGQIPLLLAFNYINMLCQSTLSSWYDFETILFSLLLLSIYWFALSFEDYHHWNVRREILVEEMKKTS